MTENLGTQKRKEVLKSIIKELHQGLSIEAAKERFEKEVGKNITSLEIAEIEQALLKDGVPVEEIKKFCNVHTLLFKSSLENQIARVESPSHPISLFKLENREIEKIIGKIKELIPANKKAEIIDELQNLRSIDIHYIRKEQLLFPYLEKVGFFGPSKVMWGKDNDVRAMLKQAILELEKSSVKEWAEKNANALIEEVEGMIFKEENILFPASAEKLKLEDWTKILEESDDVGYAFIQKPMETEALVRELKTSELTREMIANELIHLSTGNLFLNELVGMLNILPVELTFIDKEDKVKYFSANKERIFVRTKAVLGRDVRNCHPPQSVETVEKILQAFKTGKRDQAEFWIDFKDKFIYIRFFAVRDENKRYLGTIEVTQDVTGIRVLQGERRIYDERA